MHDLLTLNHDLNPTSIDILIVDDYPENIRFLSSILESKGYQTRKATSGMAALKAVETTPPNLILLDIRMPQMNGYQVCQHLKNNPQTAHIPVIFLSAADEITDKVEAFRVGGMDYVTKPFHVEEVLVRVQNQLNIVMAQQTIRQLNHCLEQRVKDRTQQLEIVNAQLLEMAFCDSLTRLPNRAMLNQRLHTALQRQQLDSGYHFSLFYLDCDRFKNINDSLGHQAGDELLVAISQRLQSSLTKEDLLTRLGGDEFVILLESFPDDQTPIQKVEGILRYFSLPFRLRERDIFVTFSIGIISDASMYSNPEDILRDADIAMYHAKSSGKNRYQVFEHYMYQEVYQRLQFEAAMVGAIDRQEFILNYQPIVELVSEQIIGVEGLVRWHHPTEGLIPPDQFIPISEETGFIVKLGLWVFRTACQQLYLWRSQGIVTPGFFISINVSACQFSQPDFVDQIGFILKETHIPPECIKLEITETVIMQNFAEMTKVIHQLHEWNIQISIDDFGTGYSSLSYLHSFPIDVLKIDRSFIRDLHQCKTSFALVNAIIQVAKTLEIDLIAEGVETHEQCLELKRLGCQRGQGYLFAKPMTPEQMTEIFLEKCISHG